MMSPSQPAHAVPVEATPTTGVIALGPPPQDWQARAERLTEGLDRDGLLWLSGYAAGLAQSHKATSAATELAPPPGLVESRSAQRLTVLYGSQTGNSRRIAETLVGNLQADGIAVRLVRADGYPLRELKDERYLAVVISTQGDGDPPDDARAFVEFLDSKRAPELPQLQFAVLGLGDSSYPKFCAVAQRIDGRLEALGARRWIARADADLDIETVAAPWSAALLIEAKQALSAKQPAATVTPLRPLSTPQTNQWSRERPYTAEVLVNQRITVGDARRGIVGKDVRHIELSLDGAGLDYEPGDALGVVIENPPRVVEAVIAALHADSDMPVSHRGDTLPLHEWLTGKCEITRLTRPLISASAQRTRTTALSALLVPQAQAEFSQWLAKTQLVDLLERYPGAWTADALIPLLRPLQPRLYSIASSRKIVGDEAHLTVAHIQYASESGLRWGAGSHFLASREEGAQLQVFLERNERFRLPADTSRNIIMIGPGTGVAPFRAFVQEREATAAAGRNWLFFGNQHSRNDFLYQLEWQSAIKRGALHRLDLAFSRDQAHKLYVQHRLNERSRELYHWLENGAHLYVCGDATRMAKDVHQALLDVIAAAGDKSPEDAAEYLNNLQSQGRYARDVY